MENIEQKNQIISGIMNDVHGVWIDIPGAGLEMQTARLNMHVFTNRYPNCAVFPPPGHDILCEGSKTRGTVTIEPIRLVQELMDAVKWRSFFPFIMADERPHEGQSNAPVNQETARGIIPIMKASFHVMTPKVKVRDTTFTRAFVRRPRDAWIVFDLPLNDNHEEQLPFVRGCLVNSTIDPGRSLVTWMELAQRRQGDVALNYEGLLENGRGFGSLRWFETLARECRRPSIYADLHLQEKEIRYLVLAQQMTRIFSLGIAYASADPTISAYLRDPTEVSFGTSVRLYEDENAVNYLTAAKSRLINGAYNTVFTYVQSLLEPPLGDAFFHVPQNQYENYVGLYMHPNEPKQRFIRAVTKGTCEATLVTAPITDQRLSKVYVRRSRKNDLILDSYGYVLCPLGAGTLLTVARQFNIGNFSSDVGVEVVTSWEYEAVGKINETIDNIQNHFPPQG